MNSILVRSPGLTRVSSRMAVGKVLSFMMHDCNILFDRAHLQCCGSELFSFPSCHRSKHVRLAMAGVELLFLHLQLGRHEAGGRSDNKETREDTKRGQSSTGTV